MITKTEEEIADILKTLKTLNINSEQDVPAKLHLEYLQQTLHHLRESIIHFEFAQPWVYYYIVHSVKLLGGSIEVGDQIKIKKCLAYCLSEGFSGGFKQIPHLAPTYAAFLTILELGPAAFDLLQKDKLMAFFKKCKQGGKFMMHEQGECDLRGSYIVAIITKMLHLDETILEGVAEIIIQSQTYEGGISNVIGGEAHGGFTFCGVAALAAMNQLHRLDLSRLLTWLTQRQVQFGGFNGRTNKLIDSCYSFWIGAVYNILNQYFEGKINFEKHMLYCQEDLQKYIQLYCQDLKNGGVWDKPGKARDIYHTCYGLSGLSLSQEFNLVLNGSKLEAVDAIYNITEQCYKTAQTFFSAE